MHLSSEFAEIVPDTRFEIDLKYASTDNFVGENMYRDFNRAYLHREAKEKLDHAAEIIQREHPGYRLLIYDALRPRSVQRILWDKVKGTHQEKYVADPDKGSMHNFGMAVDLTVIDEKGVPLDMGTGFDEFSDASQPSREDEFLANGTLSTRHITNRLILRHAMEASGFIQLPHEWWHFDAAPKAHVRAHYQIVE